MEWLTLYLYFTGPILVDEYDAPRPNGLTTREWLEALLEAPSAEASP